VLLRLRYGTLDLWQIASMREDSAQS